MRRKKEMIKGIQRRLKLKSFKEAEIVFDAVNDEYKLGLKDSGAIKMPDIGIIFIGTKKARLIKVPHKEKKIKVPERKGLFFKPNKIFEKTL